MKFDIGKSSTNYYTIGQKVITLLVVVIIIGNYFFVDCNTSPRAS